MTTSPNLGIPLVEGQQAQPEITHNEAVLLLQMALIGVTSVGLNAPPGAPANGDAYVLGAAPTGVWSGKANKIAVRINGAWQFVPGNDSAGTNIAIGAVHEGLRVWDKATDQLTVWSGSGWVPFVAGAQDFIDLGDVPAAYTGAADEFLRVNPTEDGVDFVALLAAMSAYDNAVSGLTATDVQDAIDELAAAGGVTFGSWTPSFTYQTPGTLSVSYAARIGMYAKIGRLVICFVRMFATPTNGTASGAGVITGLPFTVDAAAASLYYSQLFIGGAALNYPGTATMTGVLAVDGTTTASMNAGGDGAALASLTPAEISSGLQLRAQGLFFFLTA